METIEKVKVTKRFAGKQVKGTKGSFYCDFELNTIIDLNLYSNDLIHINQYKLYEKLEEAGLLEDTPNFTDKSLEREEDEEDVKEMEIKAELEKKAKEKLSQQIKDNIWL